jgi:hypothetical protein
VTIANVSWLQRNIIITYKTDTTDWPQDDKQMDTLLFIPGIIYLPYDNIIKKIKKDRQESTSWQVLYVRDSM